MSVEKMKMIDIIGYQSEFDSVAKQIVLSETVHMVNAFQEINSNNFILPASDEKDNVSRLIDLSYIRPYSRKDNFSDVTKEMRKLKEMCAITEKHVIKEEELIDEKALIEKEVNTLTEKFSAVYDKLQGIKRENEGISKSLDQLKLLKNLEISLQELEGLNYFDILIYKISAENAIRLQDNEENLPSIITRIYENTEKRYEVQIAFTPLQLKAQADRVFKSVNYEKIEIPEGCEGKPEAVIKILKDKLEENEKVLEELKTELNRLSGENEGQVSLLQKSVELQSKIEEVKNFTACTNEFFYLAGWIPQSLYKTFQERLAPYEDRLILVEKNPEDLGRDVKVPTKLKNSAFFRPFEAMVNVYGTPSYNEIDPTKFMAITYMIIFGLMFGDLGQGLIFVIAGLYLAKKKGRPNFGGVIYRVGAMSCLTGIFYGSLFGNETAIPAFFNNVLHLNFTFIHPMEAEYIIPVLLFSVAFGVSLLLVSYIFNLINSVKRKNLQNGLFDKNGLAGLVLYISLLLFIVVKVGNVHTVIKDYVWYIIFGVLLVVTVVKEPLANALMHKRPLYKDGAGSYYVEEGFGAIETITGFISNTLSFIRIGAFAINHAGLFLAFTVMGSLIDRGKGIGIGGVLMFILGNILIICLEGLIVFIQGLRLQFYEFFGKYYEGAGTPFQPIKLNYESNLKLEKYDSKLNLDKKQQNNLGEKKLVID